MENEWYALDACFNICEGYSWASKDHNSSFPFAKYLKVQWHTLSSHNTHLGIKEQIAQEHTVWLGWTLSTVMIQLAAILGAGHPNELCVRMHVGAQTSEKSLKMGESPLPHREKLAWNPLKNGPLEKGNFIFQAAFLRGYVSWSNRIDVIGLLSIPSWNSTQKKAPRWSKSPNHPWGLIWIKYIQLGLNKTRYVSKPSQDWFKKFLMVQNCREPTEKKVWNLVSNVRSYQDQAPHRLSRISEPSTGTTSLPMVGFSWWLDRFSEFM